MPDLYVYFPEQVRQGVKAPLSEVQANGLLHAWTLAWHPAVLHQYQTIPTRLIGDALPECLSGSVVVAAKSVMEEAAELPGRFQDRGARLVLVGSDRNSLDIDLRQLVAPGHPSVDATRASDFRALGYAALQIEDLARRLHFTNHYDPGELNERCRAAAQAVLRESDEQADAAIKACFDALLDIRHHFYPVDIYLLDWSLLPSGIQTADWEGGTTCKRNLWTTGSELAQWDSATLAMARQVIHRQGWSLIGIEEDELALPLWPADLAVAEVQRGLAIVQESLGVRPQVFARRRFGLTARIPMMLPKLGYEGAVHAVLDAGQFPRAAQPRTQWYGLGCASIDAVACVPLDARKSSTFLYLAEHLGASIESDYVATACLAGWLGRSSPWYDVLLRACQWSSAMGRSVTMAEYLGRTSAMGQHADFTVDQYASPYLTEYVTGRGANPISRWAGAWSRWSQLNASQTQVAWAAMLRPSLLESVDLLMRSLDAERRRIIAATEPRAKRLGPAESSADESEALVSEATALLAPCLFEPTRPPGSAELGHLIINTAAHPIRLALRGESPTGALEAVGSITLGDRRKEGPEELVLDVPACGYQWLPCTKLTPIAWEDAGPPVVVRRHDHRIAEEWQLRNEFLRVRIDPDSGGLAGLYAGNRAANRLSQRLFAVRCTEDQPLAADTARGGQDEPTTSQMVADSICLETNTSIRGSIVTRGRIVAADGSCRAKFLQRFELCRGMRHCTLEISLETLVPCQGRPWEDYIATRVAWRSPHAQVRGVVQEMVVPMSAERFDSPLGFEVAEDEQRTWIQSLGLPHHRRIGSRQCDTILICDGESSRSFRMRVAVDPTRPLASAITALSPPVCYPSVAPSHARGWLFHVDSKHVVVSNWRPVSRDGSVIGLRLRLMESSGQTVQACLRAARPLRFAQKCDFLDEAISVCPVEDGVARVTLAPFEWTDLECHW